MTRSSLKAHYYDQRVKNWNRDYSYSAVAMAYQLQLTTWSVTCIFTWVANSEDGGDREDNLSQQQQPAASGMRTYKIMLSYMHHKQAFIYFLVLRGNKVLWPATNMKEFRPSLSTKQQLLEWDERLLTVSDFTFSHHNYNYCTSVVYVSKLQASKPSKLIYSHIRHTVSFTILHSSSLHFPIPSSIIIIIVYHSNCVQSVSSYMASVISVTFTLFCTLSSASVGRQAGLLSYIDKKNRAASTFSLFCM